MAGTATPMLILLDGVTGTGTGPVQGIQGQAVAYKPVGLFDMPIHVFASLAGASPTSCTIIIETCNTLAGSYDTWATLALTATNNHIDLVGKMSVKYIRARVSASSGTNVINAYMKLTG